MKASILYLLVGVILLFAPSIGAISEDAIIRGTANFMSKRANQYMLQLLLERSSKSPYLQIYFPDTVEYLKQTNFLYWDRGAILASHIKKDIDHLIQKITKENSICTDQLSKDLREDKPSADKYTEKYIFAFFRIEGGKGSAFAKGEGAALEVYTKISKCLLFPNEKITEEESIIISGKIASISNELLKGEEKKSYSLIIADVLQIFDATIFKEHAGTNVSRFKRLAAVFASLLDAKEKADAEAILENTAASANSYVVKRENRVSLYLNSYLGAQIGWHNKDASTSALPQSLDFKYDSVPSYLNYGIFAPIGMELSFATHNWSFGLLFSVVDLGNAVNAELNGNTSEKFTFNKLLSPGIIIVLGLPHRPISIGGGVSYGQQIRNAAVENEWRTNIFVAFDIPIFEIL